MWGIIPAAGRGSRIQPLAFSKELLPVGSCWAGGPSAASAGAQAQPDAAMRPRGIPIDHRSNRVLDDTRRPCAVSEYLLERMIRGGADKICFVIGAGKSDILEYFGARYGAAELVYVVQQEPAGLCDAVFRAHSVISPDECVIIGLPDTVWFPADALESLPNDTLSFLLFPVERPELFDAVSLDADDRVVEIRVKQPNAGTRWIWGAIKMPGRVFHELRSLWLEPGRGDEYIGTLINAYLAGDGTAIGVKAGEAYVDVGTLDGYRSAMLLLGDEREDDFVVPSRNSTSQEMRT